MLIEHSYGVIALRKNGSAWEVLLIQHGAAGYWGFPKGHAENQETPRESAQRELFEETNLEIAQYLSDVAIEEQYHFKKSGKPVSKTVTFFVAEVKGTVILQTEEIQASRWVPLDSACEHLTYDTDRSICRQAITLIAKNASC